MEDNCFFCDAEGVLILKCQKCGANNIKKTVEMFSEITNLKERLEAWLDDDVAWDCLAEVAADYYMDGIVYRCGKCHRFKPYHNDNCLVEAAGRQLQKLKDLGEI